ncbi:MULTISPECIES: hypothetical protein [unclassified Streptomyces]|uniref:hypothetical protein n=1 Tax=unclassified Streptomyces TaxID=2593676 RepID=UPI000FFEF879|nr:MULTISPECIES: hypothetical protein [unclassified Streptomyces]
MNELTFGRPFVLRRDRDISSVSGTGIIADGIVFPDGHAAIHWRGRWPLTTPHPDGLDSILAIHDHGGQGDLHVIWADEDKERDELRADLVDIYDLPAAIFGTETERAHLHRMITRALLDAWEARGSTVSQPEQHCAAFAKAVMPIIAPLQEQRDQALRANGCAYGLAHTWKAAHGSAMFLVRAAGAELSDVLNGAEELSDDSPESSPRTRAQRLLDAFLHRGPGYELGSDDRQACPYCTGAPQFLRSELGTHIQEKHGRVLAVLASGGSLDEQLAEPETRCRLPHEMEA